MSGLWTQSRGDHYFINVGFGPIWIEVRNGRVLDMLKQISVNEQNRLVRLRSSDGKYLVLLTDTKLWFAEIDGRPIKNEHNLELFHESNGGWALSPFLDSYDDDDDMKEESARTLSKKIEKYYRKLEAQYFLF